MPKMIFVGRAALQLAAVFVLLLTASCSGLPTRVALEYWTRRASLDPGLAQYVEPGYRSQARKDCQEARERIRSIHPGMDKYRFDFSGLGALVRKTGPGRAQAILTGKARAYSEAGVLFEEVNVDEKVPLVAGTFGWYVDYSFQLDTLARRTLEELARVQNDYRKATGRFASDLNQLGGAFEPPSEVSVSILEAGPGAWRGAAYHKKTRKAYIFDSQAGCVLSEPIRLKE